MAPTTPPKTAELADLQQSVTALLDELRQIQDDLDKARREAVCLPREQLTEQVWK